MSETLYSTMIQYIKISVNLNREKLPELGRKKPYHDFIDFPVETKEDIECNQNEEAFSESLD